MEGNSLGKLAVGMLLLVFVFSLGNLIYNLENLNIAPENIPQFINPGSEELEVATSGTLANALRWIYYGFAVFCGIVAVIGAVMFASSKDRKKWRRLFIQMTGLMLGIAAIFAFAYFYEDIESSVTGIGSTDVIQGGSTNQTGGSGEPSDGPDSLRVILAFGVFAIVFMFIIVIVMAFAGLMKMKSKGLDYSGVERDSKEVARTIQRTIDALAGGSDTRATVIRCYTDMCKVLAKHGVEEQDYLTPREFLKFAAERLPVPEAKMRPLVDVFEEARYSRHDLSEEHGRRAVAALDSVRRVLVAYRAPQKPGGERPGG